MALGYCCFTSAPGNLEQGKTRVEVRGLWEFAPPQTLIPTMPSPVPFLTEKSPPSLSGSAHPHKNGLQSDETPVVLKNKRRTEPERKCGGEENGGHEQQLLTTVRRHIAVP